MRLIKKELDYPLNWTYGVSIEQIRMDLDAVEKLGATVIDIEAGSSYGDPYVSIAAYINRMETKEEAAARRKLEREAKKQREESELRQLERLKQKYEKK